MTKNFTLDGTITECNAVINSASLGIGDHGILSSFITLDYGGSGQGFGGYALFSPEWDGHERQESDKANYAGHWVWRVLEIADVKDWKDLAGRTVRVRQEHKKVHAIGHIIKDDWFYPTNDFELMQKGLPLSKKPR